MSQQLFFTDSRTKLVPWEIPVVGVASATVSKGIFGKKITFSGSQNVKSGIPLDFSKATQIETTIQFWISPKKLNTNQCIFEFARHSNSVVGLSLYIDANNDFVLKRAGYSDISILTAANYSEDEEIFLVFAFKSNALDFSKNGVELISDLDWGFSGLKSFFQTIHSGDALEDFYLGSNALSSDYFTGSLDEIKIFDGLANQDYNSYIKHGVRSDHFKAVEFVEEAKRPVDAYYFPLDGNPLGFEPAALAREASAELSDNVTLQDLVDGAWVGSTTNNLWPRKTDLKGFKTGSSNIVPPYGDTFVEMLDATDSLAALNYLPIFANQPYTVSAFYRSISPNPSLAPAQFRLVKSVGASELARSGESLSIPAGLEERWQRGFGSATYTEATATAFPYITVPANYRICGVMLENKPFVSAYTEYTNGPCKLRFNLYDSCGIRWNEDYTIMYWKKMHGTDVDGTISGYNVDSLGRNGNTIGGGFRWWGKYTDLTWGFITGGRAAFNFSDLQYQWSLIALRRIGTTLTLKIYSKNFLHSQDISDNTGGIANRYVNQNGYDLQLGGWDDGNPCNSFYRDLIVIPGRALSDNDLNSYYATKLKIEKHAVYGNSLLEGI